MPALARTLDLLVDRLEGLSGLDAAGATLTQLASRVIGPPAVKDLLSGTVLGHPLHPLLVAGPIGAWGAAVLFDLRGRPELAQPLIGLGLACAAPTALTGLSDWVDTEGAEKRVGLAHAFANDVAISLFAASYAVRRRRGPAAGVALGLAGAGALAVAGWLGGHLAYAQGVGVDTTAFTSLPGDWTDVAAATDVSTEPQSVTIDGTPVLLVRSGGQVRAVADRCTHRGGPLHEGGMEDGCLVCPWHGSRIDPTSGAVVRGPAVRPQPVLDVHEAEGRIQVRRLEQRTLRTNPV